MFVYNTNDIIALLVSARNFAYELKVESTIAEMRRLTFLYIFIGVVWFTGCNTKQMDSALEGDGVETSIAEEKEKKNKANTRAVTGEKVDVERVAKPKWRQLCYFSGTKNKKSKPFKVNGKEWKISWNVKPGTKTDSEFILILHNKKDKEDTEIITTQIGPGEDFEIYEGGQGEYYLDINSALPYQIEVLEYK